jgi:hypothetical protein
LIDFTASFVEDSENHVEINWKTVSEQNNDFFSIWRSLNGSDWETIKSVDGAENSSQLIAYQFIDRNLKVSDIMNNTLYYKLSQTDFDGSTEFFHIVSVYYKIPKTHIVKKTNLLGQDVGTNYKGIVIESWNNGETSKSYQP